MRFHHIFYLGFVFAFYDFDHSLLVAFIFLLVMRASFLQLLQGQLELPLRLNEVLLVVVFLGLQEHDFAFPEGFVSVVVALQVLEFAFCLLE